MGRSPTGNELDLLERWLEGRIRSQESGLTDKVHPDYVYASGVGAKIAFRDTLEHLRKLRSGVEDEAKDVDDQPDGEEVSLR